MLPHAQAGELHAANPHVADAIGRAATHRTIVVARDIVDAAGITRLARATVVDASLPARLDGAQLREPFEACLHVVDGVTPAGLAGAAREFIRSPHPLARRIDGRAVALEREILALPLNPAVQLLLTAAEEAGNGMYEHAVGCMLVCGALDGVQGGAGHALRNALLAGLLHDLAELYLDPEVFDPRRRLDAGGARALESHAALGRALVAGLTDYPDVVATAIAEHHERLDGSGYPARRRGAELSRLGRLLAVTEAVLGTLSGHGRFPMTRALNALTFIDGEFDPQWNDFFSAREEAPARAPPERAAAALRAGLVALQSRLERAATLAHALAQSCGGSAAASGGAGAGSRADGGAGPARDDGAAALAHHVARRLSLIRGGRTRSGLGIPARGDWREPLAADAELLAAELTFRLGALHRDATLRAAELPAPQRASVDVLLDALAG